MVAPPVGPRGPRPAARVGPFVATLLNGVFGDPLLHLRIAQHKRSVLVDLGEGAKLPARLAHQVSDVFLSHAHVDHIAGFLSFMRSRIGAWPVCRVFGPIGVAANIAGLVAGVHWDRIGHRAPRFEVTEFYDNRLHRYEVMAGRPGAEPTGTSTVEDGTLLSDELMRVESAVLDHFTPVLAFAFHASATLNVRKERLDERGLRPGLWLTELKASIAAGRGDAAIRLPGGAVHDAAELAEDLLVSAGGEKLVYATDLADTAANRTSLERLAADAHTLFCEAAFCEADTEQARRTGHLTTLACAEIANAARVKHLIPFHFSRRYERDAKRPYKELASRCRATLVPDLDSE
jgi:ribonuclease Z